MKNIIVIAIFLAGVCAQSEAMAEPQNSVSNTVKMESAMGVALKLETMPCWIECKPENVAARAHITNECYELARLESTVLRSGIESFLSKGRSNVLVEFRNNAKIYALLRIVFNIPNERFDARKSITLIGYCAPCADGKVDLLWPFTSNQNGSLALTGAEGCESDGPMFDSLRAFDECDKLFGRRKL